MFEAEFGIAIICGRDGNGMRVLLPTTQETQSMLGHQRALHQTHLTYPNARLTSIKHFDAKISGCRPKGALSYINDGNCASSSLHNTGDEA